MGNMNLNFQLNWQGLTNGEKKSIVSDNSDFALVTKNDDFCITSFSRRLMQCLKRDLMR